MSRQYSEAIMSVVRDCLDEDYWRYIFDDEAGFFRFHVNLKSTIREASIVIDVKEECFVILGILSVKADVEDETMMDRIRDYICRVNWEMDCGCFEMDGEDGELRFRHAMNCDDTEMSAEMIRNMIAAAVSALDRHTEGIAGIIFADLSVQDAIRRAEHYSQIIVSDQIKDQMKTGYSEQIAASIRAFLDEDDWHYSFDEDSGHFHFGVNLFHRIDSAAYDIDVRDDMYIVNLQPPIGIVANDKDLLERMAAYFGKLNYEFLFGNFDLDTLNGDIRFKFSVSCKDMKLSESVIRHSILTPAHMLDRYGNGIVSIIYTGASAAQAIEQCKGQEE